MKKFTTLVSSMLMTFAGNTVADEFDSMHKQLDIMSNIIKSSVSTQKSSHNSRITGVETTYLKGQGAIFTINSSSRSSHWGNYNFNFVMPEVPAIPAVPVVPDVDVRFSHNDDYDDGDDRTHIEMSNIMEKAAESYERAMDQFNDSREKYRELQEEQRDLAYDVRDLEREKRDLEYQQRRADKASKEELAQEVKKLDQQRKKIEQARKALKAKSAELRQQQQQQKQKQEKERAQYYRGLTSSLIESFCLYGNGLKAVPKNEHVSLIIKSGGEKDGNRFKDQIFVFSKKDIIDCTIDKINVETLKQKGHGYQF